MTSTFARNLGIMAATLAYLGLAILARGGLFAFFSHPALIALTIALLAMSAATLFSEGSLSPGTAGSSAPSR